MMEEQSVKLFTASMPAEWVIRRYSPDYGIDYVVEVFKYVDAKRKLADTLGDIFYVQLKSVEATKVISMEVRPRLNVEKFQGEARPPGSSDGLSLQVIPFKLDTDELLTIRAFSPGVPVLLILTCLDTEKVYYLCLNDYVDKVLLPRGRTISGKSKTVYIPIKNELKNDDTHLVHPRFYAKRAKFYSAFTKFFYQRAELRYLSNDGDESREILGRFVSVLIEFPIWTDTEIWAILGTYRDRLAQFEAYRRRKDVPTESLLEAADQLWHGLTVLASNYEELCREWCLPTHLAQFLSYPDSPE